MASSVMYLSGAKNAAIADDLAAGTMGFLVSPTTVRPLDGVKVWAMDNGCFTNKYPGDAPYLAMLNRLRRHQKRCLFVTVPDVVGDAAMTLASFQPMATRIRLDGWPVALVAQDGMEARDLPWDDFEWLFIGGSTEWKLSLAAADLIKRAKERGKRVHVGRVNSAKRFSAFAALDCDTADGTYLAFGPNVNAPDIRAWQRAAAHPRLFEERGTA